MGFINKFLCKGFDDEKKGYVTLGEFLTSIVLLFLGALVILISLYSIYIFFSLGGIFAESQETKENPYFAIGFLTFFTATGVILLFIIPKIFKLIMKRISWAWNLKIAKCERKE